MAQESFANEDIAELLNDRFISIKVDREERPDIDAIYMQACQAISGQGGWPLSVFLTPDKKPFYAGTYFPPEGRYGRPGFKELILLLSDQYKQEPKKIGRVAQQVTAVLQPRAKTPGELVCGRCGFRGSGRKILCLGAKRSYGDSGPGAGHIILRGL